MAKKLYFISSEDDTGIKLALENKEDEITVLLIQNAVYFATKTNKEISEALKQNFTIMALKEDVEARGLQNLLQNDVKLIDYGEVVDKTFESDSIINF